MTTPVAHLENIVVSLGETALPRPAWYAVIADPDGNIFAIRQADSTAMPPPEPD